VFGNNTSDLFQNKKPDLYGVPFGVHDPSIKYSFLKEQDSDEEE